MAIGTMILGKEIASFQAMAKLKSTAQPKNIMSQIQILKRAYQILK